MTKKENRFIGVIGFGDLGKRLSAQIISSGREVRVSSRRVKNNKDVELDKGVDPATNVVDLDMLSVEESMSAVLEECHIVHWAAPSDKLESLPAVPSRLTVVLHDSVMNNSKMAIESREDRNSFAIAHCLMNDARRVLVSNEFGNHEAVLKHFEDIDLNPKYMAVRQHDSLMAQTQGVFALMIELGMRSELDKAFEAGDLTPSAIELRDALINREANWTEKTIQSILKNPELKTFVSKMMELLENISKS